jgi:hypothetical protein
MGHIKMAGPGFVPKNVTIKQEPKQQKSTATIVYTVLFCSNNNGTNDFL